MLPLLSINGFRLQTDFEALAQIGQTAGGGVSRPALSVQDLEARAWFADKVEEAGLLVRDDDAGNLSGMLYCEDPNARVLILGSHLDSVPNGGRYDGSIGVLAALEVVRTIKESGLRLPVHLEVMNFTDEEGAWLPRMGSLGLTGQLTPEYLAAHGQRDAGAFRAAMVRAGIHPGDIYRARRDADAVAGYIELHIEQGCRLEETGLNIGVVTSIVGITSYWLTFHGEGGHAGTVQMRERRDALLGAALFVTEAHRLISERFPDGLVNCGMLEVKSGGFNIIPRESRVAIEFRHAGVEQLTEMEKLLLDLAYACAQTYNLSVDAKRAATVTPALMSDTITNAIEQACEQIGASTLKLSSFAGHDAQIMSTFTPTGMIFIPSVRGISHDSAEYSHWEDIERGANVLLHAVLALTEGIQQNA